MIAMSHIHMSGNLCDSMTVEYHASRADADFGFTHPAMVWVKLESVAGHSTVFLSMDHVRQLAEVLPRLLMAHDAAEHDKAVVKAAAEIDSARQAA
ncbi:hypothetical protein [Nocardia sp. NPDC058705]|uniref:hypothetical protein n=1 Tax=Nocardia sp. NPDC058705 TaxID=3346609 RepID=UPI0036A6F235